MIERPHRPVNRQLVRVDDAIPIPWSWHVIYTVLATRLDRKIDIPRLRVDWAPQQLSSDQYLPVTKYTLYGLLTPFPYLRCFRRMLSYQPDFQLIHSITDGMVIPCWTLFWVLFHIAVNASVRFRLAVLGLLVRKGRCQSWFHPVLHKESCKLKLELISSNIRYAYRLIAA